MYVPPRSKFSSSRLSERARLRGGGRSTFLTRLLHASWRAARGRARRPRRAATRTNATADVGRDGGKRQRSETARACEGTMPLGMGESLSFKVVPELYLNEPSLQMLNLMLKVAIFIYIIVVSILMNKQCLLRWIVMLSSDPSLIGMRFNWHLYFHDRFSFRS
eukprot:COSAG02_NODE_5722_length_4095_cov_5.657908_6_plen_163_part_00